MKSKSVAIVSCYYENNYGSKLQAYALQQVLDAEGYKNEYLRCSNPKNYMTQSKFLYYLKKIQDRDWDMKIGAIKKRILRKRNKELDRLISIREKAFERFVIGNIRVSKPFDGINGLARISNYYDTVLVGSDQLWSPSAIEQGFYTLEHISGVKKISYSTSFGVEDLHKSQVLRIQHALSDFQTLSVRELTGAKIIRKYLNRKSFVVLDPTLLLTKEKWTCLINLFDSKRISNEKYILFYFLGNNPEQHKIVKHLKKKTGYKIVGLLHLDTFIPEDERIVDEALFDVDPFDFIALIQNAEFICTDSFHGTVFSIIFDKQFITFPRNVNTKRNVNSRVLSLLDRLGLLDRYYSEGEDIVKKIISPINHREKNKRLNNLRYKSLSVLKKSLEE